MLDQIAVMERRRQILRATLVVIIFATMPLYCLGFVLLASAPDKTPAAVELTLSATVTPIGGGSSGGLVTATQYPTLSLTLGALPTLMPTPFQYNPPPVINPPTATIIIFIPTSTVAPTLTFPPSSTPIPTQENTPIPPPTNTQVVVIPTDIPLPTDPPPPTDLPTGVLIPPTDTPTPTVTP